MIGVARHTVADHFAVNFRAAFFGVFIFFQHHAAGAFADNKTIAAFIERARGAVPACR